MSKTQFGDVIECRDGSLWVALRWEYAVEQQWTVRVICIRTQPTKGRYHSAVGTVTVCAINGANRYEYDGTSWRLKRP